MQFTRLVTSADAPALAELLRINREFLAPWDPIRSEDYFTAPGQRAVIDADLRQHAQGSKLPHVILDDSGRVIGRITLNGIVRPLPVLRHGLLGRREPQRPRVRDQGGT